MIVYVLKNKSGKIYIGQTNSLERRLIEHNETGSGFTSKYRPWTILWQKECIDRKASMKVEKYLKSGAGRDFIKKLLK